MTYSAWPYPPLADALGSAVGRGVAVTAVVETLAGAGGALAGEEPAAAFLAIPGVQIWHWPTARRPEQASKMHAKLAVADNQVLLVTSANLTQSGIGKNIEAGLLVHGGPAPTRTAEHIRELQSSGALERMY
jgi:phosphatidylserine/phosphatidylglycerophosphate/cardiolipin synthase-like enzyme